MVASKHKIEKLVAFFSAETRVVYKKGEIIIRSEEQPTGIFYIESGFVKASITTKYGEENLLLIRGEGGIFPLIWAFTGLHREVTYRTLEPTVLRRASKKDYLEFLNKNQDILPEIMDMAIEAYRLHSERVITLSYRTVRERVVSFLITCCDRFGKKSAEGCVIEAPLIQSDIASSVNATRETASRELAMLTRRGLIKFNSDRHIVVTNMEELKKII